MANVTVMGGVAEEYGLKTAQKVQQRHNGEVAAALLNISGVGTMTGAPAHQDADRPEYQHQAFPMMLYKPDPGEKGEKIVMNEAELSAALQDGWRIDPYPRVQIAVLDPAMAQKNLQDTNNNLQAQLAIMQEQMNKMAARLEGGEETAKRGPGRPPKVTE